MDLSMGSFGSFDQQVHEAERMIGEFECQIDQAILQLEKKTKENISRKTKNRNSADPEMSKSKLKSASKTRQGSKNRGKF